MALISALAGGLVSTCERLGSRYGDGSGGEAGLGISADRPDLLCQRHNPGFSAGGWRSEPCLPNLRADLFPKPRDASVSFSLSHDSLQNEKSLGLYQVDATEVSLSLLGKFCTPPPPPITHFYIIEVWAVQMQLYCDSSCHKGRVIGTIVHL